MNNTEAQSWDHSNANMRWVSPEMKADAASGQMVDSPQLCNTYKSIRTQHENTCVYKVNTDRTEGKNINKEREDLSNGPHSPAEPFPQQQQNRHLGEYIWNIF